MADLLKSLNIDPLLILMNGALFLVLLVVLNGLFWQPIIRHLEGRKESISNAYRMVDQTRYEMEKIRADYQARLVKIEAQARQSIRESVHEAQTQRETLISEARRQSEEIMSQGEESIQQEKELSLKSMREQLDEVAFNALSGALGQPASSSHRQLIDRFIAQEINRS